MITCSACGASNRSVAKFCSRCGGRLAVPAPPPALGLTGKLPSNTLIGGRYLIVEKVGQGGMAAVYRATDTKEPGTVWAIKEMSDAAITNPADRPAAIQAFRQEAELLRRLSHPNVPAVKDVFTESGKHYLVMEFVEGWTLEEVYRHRGAPIGEAELLPWARQLCDVLHYLHTRPRPIIFRDLKPGNIMVTPEGQIKLIDFGIVRFFKAGKARDTQIIGTPGYAPPEQHGHGQTDARSDIYSLCATLHHLATGHDPLSMLFSFPPARQVNPAVSQKFDDILARGLEQAREKRWRNMAELRAALASIGQARVPLIHEKTLSGVGEPHPPPLYSSRPTTRLLMAAAGLTGGQIAFGLIGLLAAMTCSLWLLTPILYVLKFVYWDNLVGLIGPLAYAATRRRGVTFLAHTLVTISAIATAWARLPYATPIPLERLIIAAPASGLIMELGLLLIKRVRGNRGEESWFRELVWLALMAVAGVAVFFSIFYGRIAALDPLAILFSALAGGLGWFFGDLIQQYVMFRRTGLRHPTRL